MAALKASSRKYVEMAKNLRCVPDDLRTEGAAGRTIAIFEEGVEMRARALARRRAGDWRRKEEENIAAIWGGGGVGGEEVEGK